MMVLQHAHVFDGVNETLLEDADVLVEEGRIREVSSGRISSESAVRVDLSDHTLMPGLIDAHVHVYAAELNLTNVMRLPFTYLAQYANRFLAHMLDSGVTSVRDVGGGDHGLARALDDGHVIGPRLFYGGRILSQSGGHADWRPPHEDDPSHCVCSCAAVDQKLAVLADGKEGVIRAAREELRRGVSHIKILGSGGIASPSDPVDNVQYSEEEIRAIVDEAGRHGVYVAAHCHPSEAIRRCVEFGVRSIEHGTLIDDETARMVAASEAYIVPTMAVIYALHEDGEQLGLPPVSVRKVREVFHHAQEGLESMKRAGVRVGLGTDLLGAHHTRNGTEVTLRKDVFTPFEILKSATSVNAEILNAAGELGCVAPEARADLIAVRGNPLADVELLADGKKNLSLIMKGGSIHRCDL